MGWLRRLGFGLAAAGSWCGIGPRPGTDADRVHRIDQMYVDYAREFPEVPSITVEELLEARAAGQSFTLVDARSDAERRVSMIPGAIPAERVEAQPVAYQGQELVAYCTIGYRSGLWAQRMNGEGLHVRNLQGSVLSWTQAGQPLETPSGDPTRQVHVYGPLWNLVRSDYTAVW